MKATSRYYLISKHPDWEEKDRCWSLILQTNGFKMIAKASHDGFARPKQTETIQLPERYGSPYNEMGAYRHIAAAFDVTDDTMRFYADGAFVGTHQFEPGTVGKLDCTNGPKSYIGFGHRQPSSSSYVGEVADFRMYIGQALSVAEIYKQATAPGSLRSCSLPTEGEDSASFKDKQNRGCEWYQAHLEESPRICDSASVQAACPIACGLLFSVNAQPGLEPC